MKHAFLRLLAACSLSLVVIGCSSSSAPKMVGKNAPPTRIQMLSGEYLPLNQYLGKTVVLTFWATWCAHSSQTLGEIGQISKEYSHRPDIVFLTVSVDKAEDIEKVRTRLSDPGLAGTTNAFSGNAEYDEAFMSFRCNDLPRVFVISPAGLIVAEGDSAEIVRKTI